MLLGTILLIALKSNGVTERWRQTTTGLFGTLALTSRVRKDKQRIKERAGELMEVINAE